MKTTVKTNSGAAVTVRPSACIKGELVLSIRSDDGMRIEGVALTQDQCGALISGIERAIETIELRNAARAGSIAHAATERGAA